jgi:predicted type IV restriction endonuclease
MCATISTSNNLNDRERKTMPTSFQEKTTEKALREYRKKYIKKENLDKNEEDTRLMIDELLTSVLGYTKLEDFTTEKMISGRYADYIIRLNKKIRFVIEAKSIQYDLNESHLRQARNYAAEEGVDWIILSNARQVELHRVVIGKTVSSQRVFSLDLANLSTIKTAAKYLTYLTKKSVLKNEIDTYWKRFNALSDDNIRKGLGSDDVTSAMKRYIKRVSNITFSGDEIKSAIAGIMKI